MKKLIIIAMALATMAVQAQVRLNAGKDSKAVSADAMEKGTMVGRHEDNNVWLNSTRKGWRLTALDRDLQVVQTAEMDINAGRLLAVSMKGNTATLLLSAQDKKATHVLVARLSMEGETTVDTMATFETPGRKDKCLLWGATSTLGNYMAVVAVQQFADSAEYVSTALLVAPRGNVVFRREYPMTTFDQMFVTDNGCIVTLGYENTASGLDVMVNYVSANTTASSRNTIQGDPVHELGIVNVVGNRMMALGTTYGRGRKADKTCNGVLAMSFDLDSSKVHGYEYRQFSLEDVNILANQYIKKKQKSMTCENVAVLGYAPTTYGGVMAITRSFEELKSTNDGINHHIFQRLGIIVAAVDIEGQVAWMSGIRCNDRQEYSGSALRMGLVGDGDMVYIYKTESKKDPTGYDLTRAAKPQQAGKKGNLVRYSIGAKGFVEKAVLEPKSKHAFLLVTDNHEIITMRGRKLRRATVAEDTPVETPATE